MRILMLLFAVCIAAYGQTNLTDTAVDLQKIRVTGDRVSLRSAPSLEGYLLESTMRGDELVYLGSSNGWVAVEAPDRVDFWVAAQYVTDGEVQPKKLNVRAGPNQNYAKVALVLRGDKLTVRGESNGWLQIAPPAGSRVWISEDYVEFIEPPVPEVEAEPEPEAAPATEVAQEMVVAPVEEKKDDALLLVLDDSRDQGTYVELPGILRRATPGLYKLVLVDGDYEEAICLVRGQRMQMERYLNRSMLIKGKRYWAKGVDLPVLKPEKIHLDPIISD